MARFRQLRKSGVARKIRFKLAIPQELEKRNYKPAVGRVIDELREFNGIDAEIQISMGRTRKDELDMDPIQDVVDYYELEPDVFKSLHIEGKLEQSEHTEPEVIDFIKEVLRYKDEDVTYISGARRLDPESCKQAIRRGISKHASYLAKYTGV